MSSAHPLRHLAVYLGSSISTAAIGFGSVLVLTRMLAPSDYGLIGVFFSLLAFVAPVVSLSADGLIAVNKSTLNQAAYLAFQRSYIALAYTCFAALQMLFVLVWLAGGYSEGLLVGAPLFGLVRFLAGMAATEYVVEQRSVTFGMLTVATSLFSLLLTVLFITALGAWGGWRVLAMFAADLLMLSVRYRGRLGLLVRPHWDRTQLQPILSFGLPSLVAVAGGWALNEADKLIVAREAGMHLAGIYAAAAALAGIMMTFNQALTNAFYPEMFRRFADNSHCVGRIVRRYLLIFVTLALCFCAVVLGAYLLVADLLLPPRYTGGRNVFVALMLAGVAVSFYRPFGLLAEYMKWGQRRAVAITVGGMVTVIVGVSGVRLGGLLWAPAGIAAGYLCAALVLAAGLRQRRESL